jgi:hypothetical protein
MADDKNPADVASLIEAVRDLKDNEVANALRELRAEVAQLRAEHNGHHCCGAHVHAPFAPHGYLPAAYPLVSPGFEVTPYRVTCQSGANITESSGYVTMTNALSVSN